MSIASPPRATSARASAPGRAACRTRKTASDRRCAFTGFLHEERGGPPSLLRTTRVLHPRSTSATSILHPAAGSAAGDERSRRVEDLPKHRVALDEGW